MATSTITQLIAPVALTATLTTTLYTVPTGQKVIVKELLICNTDSAARAVTLYFGTGSAVANTILDALSFAAGETKFIELSTVLVAGDMIKGGASTASVVSIVASGVVVA